MTAIAQVSGVNRALVSYYFGGKAGLLAALVDTLFQNPDLGLVEEISARRRAGLPASPPFSTGNGGSRRATARTACCTSCCRTRFGTRTCGPGFVEEYRVYRDVDADCLGAAPRDLSDEELEALAAVSIAVVEGLGIQRALDPDGFDHERAWRMWRDVIGAYLTLPTG